MLGEWARDARVIADPFGGSGTTALVASELGIKCHSTEVNPFVSSISLAKLELGYMQGETAKILKRIEEDFKRARQVQRPSGPNSLIASEGTKGLFSEVVLDALLQILDTINLDENLHSRALACALAMASMECGNTVKDGKCVRYRPKWSSRTLSRDDVLHSFCRHAKLIEEDICVCSGGFSERSSNGGLLRSLGAPVFLKGLDDETIDAVVTSPPYLNSFDYTDVYMPELWLFGHVQSHEDVRALRQRTIRSHVQVPWAADAPIALPELDALVETIMSGWDHWNKNLEAMIFGYFADMKIVLENMARSLRAGGVAMIVVAESAYNGVRVPTGLFLSMIGRDVGLRLRQVRVTRLLQTSSKQTGAGFATPLREEVLVFERI